MQKHMTNNKFKIENDDDSKGLNNLQFKKFILVWLRILFPVLHYSNLIIPANKIDNCSYIVLHFS